MNKLSPLRSHKPVDDIKVIGRNNLDAESFDFKSLKQVYSNIDSTNGSIPRASTN